MFNFRKDKSKLLTRGDVMRAIVETQKENRHKYYLNLIISMIEGSTIARMPVINLERVKMVYGYYGEGDTIVYYDDHIRDDLLKEGIASYINSSEELVITISKDRVNNMK